MIKPAVFLDRDGVINENRSDYVKGWEEFVFLPGVFEPLRLLAQNHQAIVVVSNQSAVGRGLVSRETVVAIHRRMQAEIQRRGGRVDAIYYCPHHPDAGCDCRKPRPGLLLRAARELSIDLSRSYLIGDAVSDIEAALAVGCTPIFVLTGRGQEQQPAVPFHALPGSARLRNRHHGRLLSTGGRPVRGAHVRRV
ncbi:MAG TPA: D-glycero-beta-D-manno-heptose 1,7-bisphosphate 7-phosphatase, partial [Planctomycetaceae bacterium]|nr:D-glycero-beta-D-manno-heptose 1,7-bisphosphate 7-phosphatase [Planctomycetaceae bacterium]